jgi:transposase-like protein
MMAVCARLKKSGAPLTPVPSSKSERSVLDEQARLGMATTRSLERLAAAMGMLEAAPIQFELAQDVPMGGVLCALPALLAWGLLRHTRQTFTLPPGFYPLEAIFLLLAFLALGRIPSLEQMRYEPPGEWGKLLGLDRIPEVKTLRAKLGLLCKDEPRLRQWSSNLAQEWMGEAPASAGVLYIDGHVRVYHGELASLPRHYVARERLCLRGTTDYWVNAMDGQPFFVVSAPIDPGLIRMLEEQIVPRLLAEVPGQPTQEQLDQNPLLHRFIMVFDREGYSPEFFARLRKQRVAVITYHKFPKEPWPVEEFSRNTVRLINGETVELETGERGVCLSNDLWVREIRHRESSGHQTSMLSTDYINPLIQVAARMFARWCQENFFKYMREHYALDRLIEYGAQPLPETTRVVNPAWRELDRQARSQQALLTREQARFGGLNLPVAADSEQAILHEKQKGQLLQSIQQRQSQLESLKAQRKAAGKHVELKDLPEADRFSQLSTGKKHLVDTIKLIAYRAETSLVQILRENMERTDDARALARQILQSAVDLQPDATQKTLTVAIHRLTFQAHDEALNHLCEELNRTETIFPGTELRLVFQIVGSASFH